MNEALDGELARNPAIATETPGSDKGAGRKGSSQGPAWEEVVRRLQPGSTSGRAEVVPFSVAELRTTAALEGLARCSL